MIQGDNIRLRALEMEDADWIFHFENDPSLWRVTQTVTPYSRYAIEQYVLNASIQDIYGSRELRLVIESLRDQRPVGLIDLFEFDPLNRRAGVGVAIEQKERRQGFASEALQLLIQHCFRVLALHQLYCNILVSNEASIQLFEKFGFEVTGRKKEWIIKHNQWEDELFLQLFNPQTI